MSAILARFRWYRRLAGGTWRSRDGAREVYPEQFVSSAWLEEHKEESDGTAGLPHV